MKKNEYEVVIIGTGPAGLQAAIHAARAKVSVLVMGRLENSSIRGAHIENYCCMPNITGDELLKNGIEQAVKSGAEFIEEDVVETSISNSYVVLKTESGKIISTRTLIFTIGVTRNTLNVPGEANLRGYGVSYCVDCDANFFKGKPVVITGNGSAAASGALTLSAYTEPVHLVTDKMNIETSLAEQLRESKVDIIEGKKVSAIKGEKAVEAVVLDDGTEVKAEGIFIELGAKGALELAGFLGIEMDENFKHIAVNRKQETSVAGIYAAGDICGPPWQVAKAVGEGCVAGLEAAKYAKKFRN